MSNIVPAAHPDLVNAVKTLLVERGPLTEEVLVVALAENSAG